MTDLILRGGRVLDPANGIDAVMDVAVAGDRIDAVGPGLEAPPGAEVVDVHGHLVMPGLVDLHTHVYEWAADFALNADEVGIESGVTTAVDMGCTGAWCFPGLRAHVMETAATDVVAFINIMLIGAIQGGRGGPPVFDPDFASVEAIVSMHARHPDKILGIKTYAESGGFSRWGDRALALASEAAELTGLPLYIHTGELLAVDEEHRPDPHTPMDAVFAYARPGDVLGHSFSRMPDGVLGPDGVPGEALHRAVEAGVLLDVGHGLNFDFDVTRRMLDAGLAPHIVSSDVHGSLLGVHEEWACTWSLVGTMGKLLGLGVPLRDVVAGATVNPAEVLGLTDEIGTLSPGSRADISVMRSLEGPWEFTDGGGHSLHVDERWVPSHVVRAGRLHEPGRRMLRDLLDVG